MNVGILARTWFVHENRKLINIVQYVSRIISDSLEFHHKNFTICTNRQSRPCWRVPRRLKLFILPLRFDVMWSLLYPSNTKVGLMLFWRMNGYKWQIGISFNWIIFLVACLKSLMRSRCQHTVCNLSFWSVEEGSIRFVDLILFLSIEVMKRVDNLSFRVRILEILTWEQKFFETKFHSIKKMIMWNFLKSSIDFLNSFYTSLNTLNSKGNIDSN